MTLEKAVEPASRRAGGAGVVHAPWQGGLGGRRSIRGLQLAPVQVCRQGAGEDALPALGRGQLLRS